MKITKGASYIFRHKKDSLYKVPIHVKWKLVNYGLNVNSDYADIYLYALKTTHQGQQYGLFEEFKTEEELKDSFTKYFKLVEERK